MVAITLTPKVKHLDKILAHCHRRRYTAKSTIIYAGDRSETLYFIVKGSVTILIEDDDGREMIIAYLNPYMDSSRFASDITVIFQPRYDCFRISGF